MKSVTSGLLILLLIFCLINVGISATDREIYWADLVRKIDFDDPFERLTPDQIYLMSIFARVQELQKSNPGQVSEAMKEEAQEAEGVLRSEGVDIEGLLLKREEIKALRKKQAYAVVPELNDQQVRIPGYALPLEMNNQKITEFLLVPWVGACIHTPPPPPNQIVYVEIDKGFKPKTLYDPVWVSGELAVKTSTKNLFLVDGSDDINIGYHLKAKKIASYSK